MQVKAKFMGHFEDLFGAEKDVELESGASLRDLAGAVCTSKECYQAIFSDSGKPRPGVGIMKKGRRLLLLHEEDAKRNNKDVVTFYPHISV